LNPQREHFDVALISQQILPKLALKRDAVYVPGQGDKTTKHKKIRTHTRQPFTQYPKKVRIKVSNTALMVASELG